MAVLKTAFFARGYMKVLKLASSEVGWIIEKNIMGQNPVPLVNIEITDKSMFVFSSMAVRILTPNHQRSQP